jgi:hypothetical protein
MVNNIIDQSFIDRLNELNELLLKLEDVVSRLKVLGIKVKSKIFIDSGNS